MRRCSIRAWVRFVAILISLTSSLPASASLSLEHIPYYGEEFYKNVESSVHADVEKEIRRVLNNKHVAQPGKMDQVVKECTGKDPKCYEHRPVGYKAARKIIMGQLHLSDGPSGPSIRDVYCLKTFTADDFHESVPDHGQAPDNSVINVEHTWPQSRFNPSMDGNAQKSDLHHLFPADSEMNRLRGNMRFGEVDSSTVDLPCSTSKLGVVSGQTTDVFEPPTEHKGNVARALFYFSIKYNLEIDKSEESFLRRWNDLDPVDSDERLRNEEIQKLQGNRNPFVDHPELVDLVSDF